MIYNFRHRNDADKAIAVADWLGMGCLSFVIAAFFDVAYGWEWESFGGPWLYFTSMVRTI